MSDVDFKIGATSNDANAAFDNVANKAMTTGQKIQSAMREASYKMASEVKNSFEKVNSQFDSVINKVKAVQGVMLAAAAALAGGKAFKETVDQTVNMTKEAIALSRALGITTTEASVLNVALNDIYQTSDTLLAANSKLTRQLSSNEDSFNKLGVSTRDQNGNFRNSLDIMQEVNSHLAQFKEGTDRNVEAQKIYGKGFQEMLPLLNLTADTMEQARQKAEDLGLSIGENGVQSTKEYRAAMNDVGDVLDGVKKAIGMALMPVLTELGNWFASTGPALVTIFRGAIGGLVTVFHMVALDFKALWQLLQLGFKNLIEIGSTFGKMMRAVLRGDFAGAADAAKAGMAALQTNARNAFNNIMKDATEAREKIYNLFAKDTPVTTKVGVAGMSEGGTKKDSKKATSRVGEWDAILTEMRDAFERQKLEEGSFQEFSKTRERDYWKNILDTVKLSTEEKRSVSAKYYALERELRKTAFDLEMQDLQSQMNAYRVGSAERVAIAEQMATKVADKYGKESKEYKSAQDEIFKVAQEHQKQMEQLDALSMERTRNHQVGLLDLERVRIEEAAALGDITQTQKLQALAQVKEQEFQIEIQAAEEKAKLLKDDVIAYQQAMDKILEIKQKHELAKRNIEKEINIESKKNTDELFSPVEKAFEKSINGMIQNTQTLRGAVNKMAQSIAAEFANMGVKLLVQWISNQVRMTAATASGTATRNSIETAGAAKSMAIGGAASFKSIMNSAFETMAAAYKAIAGIPFVGPFLAPAVAAGAFGVVAGLAGSVMSAEGGYDIPAGLNPMTQLHEREMVLPQKQADAVRDMAESGGNSGAPVNIYGSDESKITVGQLKKLLKQMNRNFVQV